MGGCGIQKCIYEVNNKDFEKLESSLPLLNGTAVTQLRLIFAFQKCVASVAKV